MLYITPSSSLSSLSLYINYASRLLCLQYVCSVLFLVFGSQGSTGAMMHNHDGGLGKLKGRAEAV